MVAKKCKDVKCGGLHLDAIYTATGKVAKASHNKKRHKKCDGKSIREILGKNIMKIADIKYDIKLGFVTINNPKK